MSKFIGIDFSGASRPWRPNVKAPTVWLAIAKLKGGSLRLEELKPVQALNGHGHLFDQLASLLAKRDFEVAAIDAPFALPLRHMPCGQHAELLRLVRELPDGFDRRFPSGASIVALGESVAPKIEHKPLRVTEQIWRAKGVNTRSTMWCGPRGGAPFAAACLRLIERSNLAAWPWVQSKSGILAEAFPAAQLRQWGLPFFGYSHPQAEPVRAKIIAHLNERIEITADLSAIALRCTDALDAIIALFAGLAIDRWQANMPGSIEEGWISVSH
jgi:hypothetical protein